MIFRICFSGSLEKALRVVCYQSLLLYHSVYRKGKKKKKTTGYIKFLSQKAEDTASPLLPSCHHCLRCMCENLPNAKGKPFDCQKWILLQNLRLPVTSNQGVAKLTAQPLSRASLLLSHPTRHPVLTAY